MNRPWLILILSFGLSVSPCFGQEQKPPPDPTLLERLKAHPTAQKDIESIRRQLSYCWSRPAIKESPRVDIFIKLKPNGMLDDKPKILTEQKDDIASQAVVQSALKAVLDCQPFKAPESSYEFWKELDLSFVTAPPVSLQWKSVSLKCPVGNEPLEYIRQGEWGKARYRVWYKGNAAIRAATAVAPAKGGGNFDKDEIIDLLRPRNEEERKRGNRQLEITSEQMKLGCLGKLSDRKKYFEQLKANAEQFRTQGQEVQSGR